MNRLLLFLFCTFLFVNRSTANTSCKFNNGPSNEHVLNQVSSVIESKRILLSEPKNDSIRMLKLGSYKNGEIRPANLHGDWWGMFIEEDSTYFRKVEVLFTALEPDVQYDWEWSISVENDEKCDWLIQGIDFVGAAVKYESSTNRSYGGGNLREPKKICIDAVYSCFISDHLNDDLGYQFIYTNEEGESQQVIRYLGYSEAYMQEATPIYVDIDWIGDMDGDGFNDFILSYNSSELEHKTALYLSSKAEEGELVKEVAFVMDRGC
ncbi:MAG: hypothetical protein MK105_02790 [Crocinitomicaceae bacterium]|nr:hypothetical protein [Crocinitomicaceae bacterium]